MPAPPFDIAMIQMRVEGGRPGANLQRALAHIEQAVLKGAHLVVLPEALDLGWTHDTTLAQPIPNGTFCQPLRDAARQHDIHLCAGLIERDHDRCYNAAVLISPRGDILLHHRKINELEIAHDHYALGDRLAVADTPLGRIGILICADAFAHGQVLTRSLAWMGADIILSPCAWAVPADHDHQKTPYGSLWLDNYQPVAADHQLWMAGVSNVGWLQEGPWRGRKCIGHSLLINPKGQVELQGPYGPDAEIILTATIQIEPRPAQGDGWNQHLQTS